MFFWQDLAPPNQCYFFFLPSFLCNLRRPLWFKSPSSVHSITSISCDKILRCAFGESLNIIDELVGEGLHRLAACPCNMRREDEIWQI